MFPYPTLLLVIIASSLIQQAHSLSTTNVTIPSVNDLTLEGTLRLPSDKSSNGGVPGVVVIHGSGPNSRDEVLSGQLDMVFNFSIPVFKEIGEALQRRGIAVLTYDKRTCGTFNNCSVNNYPFPDENLTIDVFIEDALAAASWLQEREEISSVSVAGHSQSGQFVPIMLNADPTIAKGIMLAGPYGPIEELIEYQLNFTLDLLEQFGVNRSVALETEAVAPLVQLLDGLNSILNGTFNGTTFSGASTEFWKSWSDLQQRALAATVTQPVLVLNGELDTNVPPSEAELWSDHFTQTQVEHRLEILPCITHALNCLSESNFTQVTPEDIGRNVAPSVIDVISNFILSWDESANGNTTTSGVNKSLEIWFRVASAVIGGIGTAYIFLS